MRSLINRKKSSDVLMIPNNNHHKLAVGPTRVVIGGNGRHMMMLLVRSTMCFHFSKNNLEGKHNILAVNALVYPKIHRLNMIITSNVQSKVLDRDMLSSDIIFYRPIKTQIFYTRVGQHGVQSSTGDNLILIGGFSACSSIFTQDKLDRILFTNEKHTKLLTIACLYQPIFFLNYKVDKARKCSFSW